MKFSSEIIDIADLKGYEFDLADAKEAYKYDEVLKKVGEYAGRIHGKDMRNLVINNTELTLIEPTYPSSDKDREPSKKDIAIWNKKYDLYLKKVDVYEDQKAKVFVLVMGRYTIQMMNRIEKLGNYEDLDKNHDVVGLLKAIKAQVFAANERKCASLRSVVAWKKLTGCRQNDGEYLIECYKRFVGLIEAVELSYGDIQPSGSNPDKERSKFIAFMFMDGADKKQYGYLLKNLETDYSLGKKDVYPDGIESALQVLILFSEKKLRKKVAKNFANVKDNGCWECGAEDHQRKDCPVFQMKQMKRFKKEETFVQHTRYNVWCPDCGLNCL